VSNVRRKAVAQTNFVVKVLSLLTTFVCRCKAWVGERKLDSSRLQPGNAALQWQWGGSDRAHMIVRRGRSLAANGAIDHSEQAPLKKPSSSFPSKRRSIKRGPEPIGAAPRPFWGSATHGGQAAVSERWHCKSVENGRRRSSIVKRGREKATGKPKKCLP
jgi:hypothetical protein